MTSSGGGPTDLDSPVRVVVDAVAAHFRVALRDLGLTAPASTVGVALHPAARHGDDTVRVLVWCDPPDGAEIITADLPHGWAARSATEVAHLVAAVIATGLTRLASARGWDLGEALDIGRAAVEQEFGTGTEPWQVVAEGRGASAPEQPHEILIVGGGPGNGVPKAYLDELSRLLHIVAGDTWRAWWPHSPVKVAEVSGATQNFGSRPAIAACGPKCCVRSEVLRSWRWCFAARLQRRGLSRRGAGPPRSPRPARRRAPGSGPEGPGAGGTVRSATAR